MRHLFLELLLTYCDGTLYALSLDFPEREYHWYAMQQRNNGQDRRDNAATSGTIESVWVGLGQCGLNATRARVIFIDCVLRNQVTYHIHMDCAIYLCWRRYTMRYASPTQVECGSVVFPTPH